VTGNSRAVGTSKPTVNQTGEKTGAITAPATAGKTGAGPVWHSAQQWSDAWWDSCSAERATDWAQTTAHTRNNINNKRRLRVPECNIAYDQYIGTRREDRRSYCALEEAGKVTG
jgi:hypothetical protein